MWRIVEAKQNVSRRREELLNVKKKHVDAISSSTPSFSAQTVSVVARDLCGASRALQKMNVVRVDVLSPLREYLKEHATGVTYVHLLALGIGPFLREESRLGFLQMALFLAMKSECETTLRKLGKSVKWAALENESRKTVCEGSTALHFDAQTVTLFASFFDPMSGELHAQCCEKLGVKVEEKNRHGAYTTIGSNALLIVYLPHCPWALLRNVFISNIAFFRDCAGVEQLQGLRSTLVIGNDIREQPGIANDILKTLIPYLRFHEVRVRDKKNNYCSDNFAKDVGDFFLVLPKGIGKNDVLAAFSGTVVMQLNMEREEELLKALQSVNIPKIASCGLDLI